MLNSSTSLDSDQSQPTNTGAAVPLRLTPGSRQSLHYSLHHSLPHCLPHSLVAAIVEHSNSTPLFSPSLAYSHLSWHQLSSSIRSCLLSCHMTTLLRIDVSPRSDHSISRKLGDAFVAEWLKKHSSGTVTERDLAETRLPFIDMP